MIYFITKFFFRLRLAEVGILETPKLQGKYDTGQVENELLINWQSYRSVDVYRQYLSANGINNNGVLLFEIWHYKYECAIFSAYRIFTNEKTNYY